MSEAKDRLIWGFAYACPALMPVVGGLNAMVARCSLDTPASQRLDKISQHTVLGADRQHVRVDHSLSGRTRTWPGLREALALCRAGKVLTRLRGFLWTILCWWRRANGQVFPDTSYGSPRGDSSTARVSGDWCSHPEAGTAAGTGQTQPARNAGPRSQ